MRIVFEHLKIGPVDHVEYEEEKRGEEEEESVHIVISATYDDDVKIMYEDNMMVWGMRTIKISRYEMKKWHDEGGMKSF